LENRAKLEEVIPLRTPMILFVDPCSACNFRCRFCPNGDAQLIRQTGRWQGSMTLDLFQKIVDDLREFEEPLKVLRLYKDGEPLLNARLPEMIAYAKAARIADFIDTTTNGFLLSCDRGRSLLDAGLDRINISVDGMSDAQFLEFTGVRVKFDQFVDNIRTFYEMKGACEVCVKIAGDYLSEEDKANFFETFGDISDRIFIENTAPCWPEFDVEGRLNIAIQKGIYDQEISQVNTCPYIFYSISINSDGMASLCFLDWARKLLIGDARVQTIKEIWHGDALYRHQVAHLNGRRSDNAICCECGQLSHGLPDNIDPYADELLLKLRAARAGN
jgi:MoaA/NifB/PqqE/SkfB family radical SAM enzyme